MEIHTSVLLPFLVLACLLTSSTPTMTDGHATPSAQASTMDGNGDASSRHTYIVRVRPPENYSIDVRPADLESWYMSFLPPTMAAPKTQPPFVYTYSMAIIGFAVNLTDDEAAYVAKKDGVLKVYPDRLVPLLTTHTPDFLGLRPKNGVWDSSGMGEGVIVGVLDTGIDFAHASFGDDGMHAPPSKWHGSCDFKEVSCNKKVIGGKKFLGGPLPEPPMDIDGHGTHTATTAAGSFIDGANVLGSGNGTAAGMAPRAHLAIYQVCATTGCFGSDVLAGMDMAISDGVDMMSLSLGSDSQPFYNDVIAIGAFSAMQKGIFVSCAGGNSGPQPGTLSNEAPWILTVGASTMDRRMKAIVKLGDGRSFVGESAYQPSSLASAPLVYPLSPHGTNCAIGMTGVAGKVAACERAGDRVEIGEIVKQAGGVGMILLGQEYDGCTTLAEAHVLPASYVDYADAAAIKKYIASAKKPTASITFNGTSLGTSPAPVVAFFSSRGPSRASPGILKPDVIGPGVNVIAAWPFKVGPKEEGHGEMTFNTLSGTSMSTPHLSAIAALIKSAHPDWSPSAIKSAIMTTANVVDNDGKPILDEKLNPAGFFTTGAGHVNPSKAINPGLVYDVDELQYIAYLCGLGYTDDQVETITQRKAACQKASKITEAELNYPSIAVSASTGKRTVNRTVTNVGNATAKYTVDVSMPKEVTVSVSPTTLEFAKANEKKSFTVSLSWDASKTTHAEGSFKWVSDKQVVRSPIVIF